MKKLWIEEIRYPRQTPRNDISSSFHLQISTSIVFTSNIP